MGKKKIVLYLIIVILFYYFKLLREINQIIKENNLKVYSIRNLNLIRKIGKGSFGKVYEAFLKSSSSSSNDEHVAIKKLNNDEYVNTNELLNEAIMLQNCKHLNLVKLYGVCLKNDKIHYLILEYMNKGDLHNYLLIKNKLDICEIILIAIQIADACEYLEENKIVHRDLAARNCLLSSINCSNKLVVKIADFGLARNLDSNNIYKLKFFNKLPVRWLAPESVSKGVFSIKSDVW